MLRLPRRPAGFERDDAYLASLEGGEALAEGGELDDDEGATWTTDNAAITERNIAMQQVGWGCCAGWQAGISGRQAGGRAGRLGRGLDPLLRPCIFDRVFTSASGSGRPPGLA